MSEPNSKHDLGTLRDYMIDNNNQMNNMNQFIKDSNNSMKNMSNKEVKETYNNLVKNSNMTHKLNERGEVTEENYNFSDYDEEFSQKIKEMNDAVYKLKLIKNFSPKNSSQRLNQSKQLSSSSIDEEYINYANLTKKLHNELEEEVTKTKTKTMMLLDLSNKFKQTQQEQKHMIDLLRKHSLEELKTKQEEIIILYKYIQELSEL